MVNVYKPVECLYTRNNRFLNRFDNRLSRKRGFTTDTNVSPSIFGFTNFTSYPCDFANGCIEWLKCS